ncbi:MAG TPA: flagellar basal body-associated FliL family protein [Bdellovibrionales bacterium]|nr:flagellar basal body-associated FliL family protein [Bdellovibrionales bacterium]
MAEQNAAQTEPTAEKPPEIKVQRPTFFIVLAVLNMVVVAAVAFLLYKGRQKEAAQPKIDDVIKGEAQAQQDDKAEDEQYIGTLIPMETFLVNLAGSRGNKVAKINLELEVDGPKVQEEIEKRKPQVRDIIIILLSGKTFEQVSTKEGKDALRDEIRDTVNSFLTKGLIKRVYFTEFIFN